MNSSGLFFRNSLYHKEQRYNHRQETANLLDTLSPWQEKEAIPYQLMHPAKKNPTPKKKILGQSLILQPLSNKKAEQKPQVISERTAIKESLQEIIQSTQLSATLPPLHPLNPIQDYVMSSQILPEQIVIRSKEKKVKPKYQQMSIRQFLQQQRSKMYTRAESKNKTAAEDKLNNNLFVRRNFRRGYSHEKRNKTLDLQKQLGDPLELYQRKSIISLNAPLQQLKTSQKYQLRT